MKDTWCAPAGVQMTLAYLGLATRRSASSASCTVRVKEWESYDDSHNGAVGPVGDGARARGVRRARLRGPRRTTRAWTPLRDAAVAIETTKSPVILLAWRGAHTWVMTGFRADADPSVFPNAKISGAYILDPWYPWDSSIWGQSDPPGTFQDADEMVRNFLPGSGPRATIRIATACTSPSSRPSRRRPTDARWPVPADRRTRAEEDGEQDVLGDHPGRVAEGDREDPGRRLEELAGDDHDAETRERGDDLSERVVRRVQPARERVGQRIERDRQGERGDDERGRRRRPPR